MRWNGRSAKARASWSGSGDTASENVWFPLREKLGATEFLGYETETAEGVVAALVKDGKDADSLKAGESGAIVLNQTPFYAESGGQVGDTGVMIGEGVHFRVTDTQKKAGDLFVHLGTVEQGTLKAGTALALEVDHARRSSIRAHHSATHLLHEALRQVLGDHIAQRGSLVAPDRLRFDFVHPKPITAEELARVEDIANDVVLENDEVTTRLMAVDDARDAGARALFGEKYGDEVRVVSMGRSAREHGSNALGWSVELCGGTHVQAHRRHRPHFGDRRKRGCLRRPPHRGADRQPCAQARQRHHGAGAGPRRPSCAPALDEMPARIAALMEERKKLERDLSEARKKLAMGGGAPRSTDRRGPAGDPRRRRRQADGARGRRHRDARTSRASPTTARSSSAPAWSPLSASPRTARPASWSASPPISSRASARSIWSRSPPTRSAARAAAGGPTWRRPAVPMAPRPTRRLSAIEKAMGGA